MSADIVINVVIIVLLVVIVLYVVAKDKEVERKIKNIELAIDEILKSKHKDNQLLEAILKKESDIDIDSLKNKIEPSLKENIKLAINIELKNHFKEYIKKEIDVAITPLLNNLSNIEEDIKEFQFEHQDRMEKKKKKNRQADKIIMMSQNEEEQQILDMYSKGYSTEDIARELKIASGRVEFIIKLKSKNA